MNSTLKRRFGACGAAAVVAGTALMAAPAAQAAQADSGYYGTWNLTAWKIDGKIVNCPGKVPLPPPAPTIECKGGETLKLRSNNTYKSTLDVIRMESHGGEFEVTKFATNKYRTIIFQSFDVKEDPSPYQLQFQGKTSAGTPKTMVISTRISPGPGQDKVLISMVFSRDAN
jgi:hypothetical protein